MAKAPEVLDLLQQRLLLAEKEAEALVQDMGVLGISRNQILGCTETDDATQKPLSPLRKEIQGAESVLWQHCGSLVSRVCHMESLLQTLKLTVFRLKTERELHPSHTANLKQQIAALQRDSEEEQQAWRREVMKLRDQLHQAYQERDDARTEVQRLCETAEAATAAKVDVALAAEELKVVKLEMREKLGEMKERMRQESTSCAEAMKSHSELLQQVKEMERVVEMERRQSLLLQSDCQFLCTEVQTSHQLLEKEKGRGRQLEERCQQLKEQIGIKDFLVFELKTQLKRQQRENSELLKEGKEIRAAAGRVQADRNEALKQLHEQNLLLTAAGRNIQTELKKALRNNIFLQEEIEKLKGEHAQLLHSSCTAQETADNQKEIHERIIERLREELNIAQKKQEAMRKDLEHSNELEGEKSSLETQFIKAKRDAESLSSALQSQQDENRRLMEKVDTLEQQQHTVQQVDQMLRDSEGNLSELEILQGVCGPAGGSASQTLENILASHTGLQLTSQTLCQELGGQDQELASLKDRLQAQREIRKHQVEVEKLQRLLTYSYWKNNRAFTITDSSTRSGDQVKINQELRQRVSELERLVSKQNACIREQRNQLKQQQKRRSLQDNSQKAERAEGTKEQADSNIQEIRTNPERVLSKWEPEMERWTCTIQRWETKRAGSHH